MIHCLFVIVTFIFRTYSLHYCREYESIIKNYHNRLQYLNVIYQLLSKNY